MQKLLATVTVNSPLSSLIYRGDIRRAYSRRKMCLKGTALWQCLAENLPARSASRAYSLLVQTSY